MFEIASWDGMEYSSGLNGIKNGESLVLIKESQNLDYLESVVYKIWRLYFEVWGPIASACRPLFKVYGTLPTVTLVSDGWDRNEESSNKCILLVDM